MRAKHINIIAKYFLIMCSTRIEFLIRQAQDSSVVSQRSQHDMSSPESIHASFIRDAHALAAVAERELSSEALSEARRLLVSAQRALARLELIASR
jgi:hypothetical protein